MRRTRVSPPPPSFRSRFGGRGEKLKEFGERDVEDENKTPRWDWRLFWIPNGGADPSLSPGSLPAPAPTQDSVLRSERKSPRGARRPPPRLEALLGEYFYRHEPGFSAAAPGGPRVHLQPGQGSARPPLSCQSPQIHRPHKVPSPPLSPPSRVLLPSPRKHPANNFPG